MRSRWPASKWRPAIRWLRPSRTWWWRASLPWMPIRVPNDCACARWMPDRSSAFRSCAALPTRGLASRCPVHWSGQCCPMVCRSARAACAGWKAPACSARRANSASPRITRACSNSTLGLTRAPICAPHLRSTTISSCSSSPPIGPTVWACAALPGRCRRSVVPPWRRCPRSHWTVPSLTACRCVSMRQSFAAASVVASSAV